MRPGAATTGLGLGGTPSLGRLRERRPLFGGVYVLELYPLIWLGAPRPAWRPLGGLLGLPWRMPMGVSQNFWGGTYNEVSVFIHSFALKIVIRMTARLLGKCTVVL